MKLKFDVAFDYLMQNEGGAVNDPADSGGPTNYGITQRSYEHYLGRAVTIEELNSISLDNAKQFYFESFWVPLGCHEIEALSSAIAVFDTAVLYGPWFAAHTAQMVAVKKGHPLKLDGLLGDKSRAAINSISAPDFVMGVYTAILDRIELVVKNDSKNERFRRGWKNRADRLLSLIKPVTKDV